MIFLCTMHCYRRARRRQEVELHAARGPVSLPEVREAVLRPCFANGQQKLRGSQAMERMSRSSVKRRASKL